MVELARVFPGDVGSVGSANRIAVLALTLALVLAVLAMPIKLGCLR
jgi:UDP-N-acetylmuramyl pentapeptide phosphotransferase/UDP-N-acetylglucosamine-1-phosphate transferase